MSWRVCTVEYVTCTAAAVLHFEMEPGASRQEASNGVLSIGRSAVPHLSYLVLRRSCSCRIQAIVGMITAHCGQRPCELHILFPRICWQFMRALLQLTLNHFRVIRCMLIENASHNEIKGEARFPRALASETDRGLSTDLPSSICF